MATVITNLLSAIPFFGHDLVESNFHCYAEIKNFVDNNFIKLLNILPTIGTINKQALKKGRTLRLNKENYLSIPGQFIAFLIGLIDGDGYIQITKTTKGFITIKLVITLNITDLSTLEYIHSVLKLGKITIYKDNKNPICKLIINKTDLQEILFPLLVYNKIFFLTNTRRDQFNLAMFIMERNIKLFKDLPKEKFSYLPFNLPNSPLEYLHLHFFKNWIVGFTNAEGSFLMKQNKDGCFQLKQKTHNNLFNALKLLFNSERKISIENNKYLQFSVSSKKDIQAVINFFSFSGLHPLIGLKSIQYFKWLSNLQNSFRYKNLNFPK